MKNSQAFLKPPPSSSISSSSLIISSKREIEIFSYNFITLVTIAYLTFSHVCLCFKLRFFPLLPSSPSYSLVVFISMSSRVIFHTSYMPWYGNFLSNFHNFPLSNALLPACHMRGRICCMREDDEWRNREILSGGMWTSRNHFEYFSNLKFQFKGKLVNDNTKIGKTSARFPNLNKH